MEVYWNKKIISIFYSSKKKIWWYSDNLQVVPNPVAVRKMLEEILPKML